MLMWSDEKLKQAIGEIEDALSTLKQLGDSSSDADDDSDVRAHSFGWSDETLKQAISNLQSALQSLKQIETKK